MENDLIRDITIIFLRYGSMKRLFTMCIQEVLGPENVTGRRERTRSKIIQ